MFCVETNYELESDLLLKHRYLHIFSFMLYCSNYINQYFTFSKQALNESVDFCDRSYKGPHEINKYD